MNLTVCVDDFAKKFGNSKPAIIFDDTGEQWTYPQLNNNINRISNAICDAGIKVGSRVAVMVKSKPELIFCSYAIYRMGGIYTVINSRLKENETEHIITNSGAEMLICDASVVPLIQKIRNKCEGLNHIIVYGEGDIAEDMIRFDDFIDGKSDDYPVNPQINEIAAIYYTGGTTGVPKGVVLTHKGIIENNFNSSARLKYDNDTIVVTANPMFHIGGMAGGPYYTFLHGGTMVLQEFFKAEKYVEAVKKYNANHIWGVPTFYYSINHLPKKIVPDDTFKNVRMAFSAAGVFYTPIRKEFENRFGLKIYQYYGLTENCPGVTVEDPDATEERRYESVGTALPETEIKIVGDDDNELPNGEIGELCVRSPHLMKEYWKNPEATKKTLRGGWLHTGDTGYIDDKGYFFIKGRKHDMILVGGANVYPAEIEKLIMEDEPRLKNVSVVGIYDERLGEIPKAFAVLKEGEQMTEQEIIDLSRSKMAHYKAPRQVEFIDTLPMTTVGKVDKRALQKRG